MNYGVNIKCKDHFISLLAISYPLQTQTLTTRSTVTHKKGSLQCRRLVGAIELALSLRPPLDAMPIAHPLGRTFFLSPVVPCMKNSIWRLNFLRCQRSLEEITPALQATKMVTIIQGVKLRLIQAPMKLNFSLWRPNSEN